MSADDARSGTTSRANVMGLLALQDNTLEEDICHWDWQRATRTSNLQTQRHDGTAQQQAAGQAQRPHNSGAADAHARSPTSNHAVGDTVHNCHASHGSASQLPIRTMSGLRATARPFVPDACIEKAWQDRMRVRTVGAVSPACAAQQQSHHGHSTACTSSVHPPQAVTEEAFTVIDDDDDTWSQCSRRSRRKQRNNNTRALAYNNNNNSVSNAVAVGAATAQHALAAQARTHAAAVDGAAGASKVDAALQQRGTHHTGTAAAVAPWDGTAGQRTALSDVPRDVMYSILQHLNRATALTMRRVNKEWCAVASMLFRSLHINMTGTHAALLPSCTADVPLNPTLFNANFSSLQSLRLTHVPLEFGVAAKLNALSRVTSLTVDSCCMSAAALDMLCNSACSVRRLSFTKLAVTNHHCMIIAQLPLLTDLSLTSCTEFSDTAVSRLMDGLTRLTRLCLSGCWQLSDNVGYFIACDEHGEQRQHTLQHIDISNMAHMSPLSPAEADLVHAYRCKKRQKKGLCARCWRDDCEQRDACAHTLPPEDYPAVKGCVIGQSAGLVYRSTEDLDYLVTGRITAAVLRHLACVSSLRSLCIAGTETILGGGVRYVGACSLTHLDMKGITAPTNAFYRIPTFYDEMDDDGIYLRSICSSPTLRMSLESLELQGCDMDCSVWQSLCCFDSLTRLVMTDVCSLPFLPDICQGLTSLKSLKIVLKKASVHPGILRGLQHATTLQQLHIRGFERLSDEVVPCVHDARDCTLQQLIGWLPATLRDLAIVDCCNVLGHGLVKMGSMLQLTRLELAGLAAAPPSWPLPHDVTHNNGAFDRGVRALCEELSDLQQLVLHDVPITCKALAHLTRLNQLTHLTLRHCCMNERCEMTADAVKIIRRFPFTVTCVAGSKQRPHAVSTADMVQGGSCIAHCIMSQQEMTGMEMWTWMEERDEAHCKAHRHIGHRERPCRSMNPWRQECSMPLLLA